ALVAGVLAGLAALARWRGITVIGGVVLTLVVSWRRREAVAATLGALAALLPWLLWSRVHRGEVDPALAANYGTYGDFLRQGGVQFSFASLSEMARPLAAITLPPVGAALRVVLGLFALLVLIVGMAELTH